MKITQYYLIEGSNCLSTIENITSLVFVQSMMYGMSMKMPINVNYFDFTKKISIQIF
jgi:hypothetical protein